MLTPSSAATTTDPWLTPVPFPLSVDYADYMSTIRVQSDDDSDLGRRFRYLTRFPGLVRDYGGPQDLLMIAARIGDLSFLDAMRVRFGGVCFSPCYIDACLQNGHLDFLRYLVELSKPTCILAGSRPLQAGWAYSRCDVFRRLFQAMDMSEVLPPVDLIRALYDDVLLGYPSRDALLRRYLAPERVAPLRHHQPAAFLPIADAHEVFGFGAEHWYPDLGPGEYGPLLDDLIRHRHRHPALVAFLVEERGLRFLAHHVAIAAGTAMARTYAYVLGWLRPELDAAALAAQHPLQSGGDRDLLRSLDGGFSARYRAALLTELLFARPALSAKIVRLLAFLDEQRKAADDVRGLRRRRKARVCAPRFATLLLHQARGEGRALGEYVAELSAFLRATLDAMTTVDPDRFQTIDWTTMAPVDFECYP